MRGKHNRTPHSEKDRIEAYAVYRDTRSIKKTAEQTEISSNTVKMWRRRFAWDQKLEDEQAEFSREIGKSLDSMNKVAGVLSEIDDYDTASQTPLSVASNLSLIPKITSVGVTAPITGEDLEVLASKAFVAREMTTLRLLEAIAKKTIEEGKLKPKSIKEVLDTLRYVSERYDKLIDRLCVINKTESSQQGDDEFVYIEADGKGEVIRAEEAMFFQDAIKTKDSGGGSYLAGECKIQKEN